MKYSSYVLYLVIIFYSCKNENLTPIDCNGCCEQSFIKNSKAYTNLFYGEIRTSCPKFSKMLTPDKYFYHFISVNPNDEYEFCYLRSNTVGNHHIFDLYKFNFCTEKTTLLFPNAAPYQTNWGSNNWILFGNDEGKCKIKSNGDSLQILNKDNIFNVLWSPTGTKYIEEDKILDQKGKLIKKLPFQIINYVWLTDSTIVYIIPKNDTSGDLELVKYNLNDEHSEVVFSEPLDGLYDLNFVNARYGYIYLSVGKNEIQKQIIKINTDTWKGTILGKFNQSYEMQGIHQLKNSILCWQVLQDTLTGNPCEFNQRRHICIMNLDGSEKRQVLIPE